MPARTLLTPGTVSPTRPVPAHIPRPEYVGKDRPSRSNDPWVQTPEVIEAMRVASRIAALALQVGGEAVAPGVTTVKRILGRTRKVRCDSLQISITSSLFARGVGGGA